MTKPFDPSSLPDDVHRAAAAQVAAGRFASVEDVVRAGVQAVADRDDEQIAWLAHLRGEASEGFAALDRGEGVHVTPDELKARLDRTVRARVNHRPGD